MFWWSEQWKCVDWNLRSVNGWQCPSPSNPNCQLTLIKWLTIQDSKTTFSPLQLPDTCIWLSFSRWFRIWNQNFFIDWIRGLGASEKWYHGNHVVFYFSKYNSNSYFIKNTIRKVSPGSDRNKYSQICWVLLDYYMDLVGMVWKSF